MCQLSHVYFPCVFFGVSLYFFLWYRLSVSAGLHTLPWCLMCMPPKFEIPCRTRQISDSDLNYKPSQQQNTNTRDNHFLRSTAEVTTVATLFEETVEFFIPTMSHTFTYEEDTIFAISNPPDLKTIAPQQGERSKASVLSMMSEILKQFKA